VAVRCGTCGAESVPALRRGSFDEMAARSGRPIPSSGESLAGFVLFVVAPFSALAGVLTLTTDEPGSVRFLGLMIGVGIGARCGGMAALLLRPPAS
jgi:hypothetical protein